MGDAEMEDVPQCLAAFVDEGSVESHRYFLARRTALEMLRDRGYSVSPDDIALTLPAFRAKFGNSPRTADLRISCALVADPSKKILVIFCEPEPFKLSTARNIYATLDKNNLSRIILILQSKETAKARDVLKEFKIKVEVFQITELLVNITKHVLKPKHELLTPEEKQKLLKQYGAKDSQLPRMLESDAVARYYGYEKGQVVKVSYDGELTGSTVTYRCIM